MSDGLSRKGNQKRESGRSNVKEQYGTYERGREDPKISNDESGGMCSRARARMVSGEASRTLLSRQLKAARVGDPGVFSRWV